MLIRKILANKDKTAFIIISKTATGKSQQISMLHAGIPSKCYLTLVMEKRSMTKS